jgi:hypothetical protein
MEYLTGSESTLRLIGAKLYGNLAAYAMRPLDDTNNYFYGSLRSLRIALGIRLLRRRSRTKSVSAPSSSARRCAIRCSMARSARCGSIASSNPLARLLDQALAPFSGDDHRGPGD